MLTLSNSTDFCRLMAEPTRLRLLALLAEEELTVAELTAVTRLTQSRVSTHLGRLREAKLVRDRRAGSSCFYALNTGEMAPEIRQIWETLRGSTHDALIDEDLERVGEVVRAREGGNWADAVAGRMHRHYSPGRGWESGARALLGLSRLGRVLDVASGDGTIAELVAPRASSVTCLDVSERVVHAGRQRLQHLPHVRFLQGDMEHLPFASASFDQVLLLNALTYADEPNTVLKECRRVLAPGGKLVASTLNRHRHAEDVARYNHRILGFEIDELRDACTAAGLELELCDITCREDRKPHFEIITVHASAPGGHLAAHATSSENSPEKGESLS